MGNDEYFYYVKAVPKMTVAAQTKTVKKINSQKRPAAAPRTTGARPVQRSVMSEPARVKRTAPAREVDIKKTSTGGRSMTIGNVDDNGFEMFEELD